jgi:hypothetical protein
MNDKECPGYQLNMCRNEETYFFDINLSEHHSLVQIIHFVRFEVFRAATMKNAIFWEVAPGGPCENRCFGETY